MINEVYIDSRYPGDLGLLPHGKPTIELTWKPFTLLGFKNKKIKFVSHSSSLNHHSYKDHNNTEISTTYICERMMNKTL
jgi:hypothetical protein